MELDLSKNGELNIFMQYAHGEIIGKNQLYSSTFRLKSERLFILLISLKILIVKSESIRKISYHSQMMML